MRTAIGLIALGVVGGVVPTGFAAIPWAAVLLVVACTSAALLLLLAACVIGASLARPSRPEAPAPQLTLRHAATTRSAPRII